jgi:hypothetical protein
MKTPLFLNGTDRDNKLLLFLNDDSHCGSAHRRRCKSKVFQVPKLFCPACACSALLAGASPLFSKAFVVDS